MGAKKKPKWPFVFGTTIGAGLAYFLDPVKGTTRREKAAKTVPESAKPSTFGTQAVESIKTRMPGKRDNPNPDDLTLRDRIESEVFRDPSIPKGDVNIDVVNGVAELRGELKDQEAIDNLISRVRSVADVRDVRSYLHMPGTPAPNKESALDA